MDFPAGGPDLRRPDAAIPGSDPMGRIPDRLRWTIAAAAALALGCGVSTLPTDPYLLGSPIGRPPRAPGLVVWLVVDQGRGDLVDRLESHLIPGGFERFRRE